MAIMSTSRQAAGRQLCVCAQMRVYVSDPRPSTPKALPPTPRRDGAPPEARTLSPAPNPRACAFSESRVCVRVHRCVAWASASACVYATRLGPISPPESPGSGPVCPGVGLSRFAPPARTHDCAHTEERGRRGGDYRGGVVGRGEAPPSRTSSPSTGLTALRFALKGLENLEGPLPPPTVSARQPPLGGRREGSR